MPWSGGSFTRVHDWTTDEAGAIDIESSRMDVEDDGFATGIDSCLHKAGQNAATGNLPMGTNRHTGVGDAQALTDYASAADVLDQHLTYYVDSGAADAYVITPSPSISAYAEGQRLVFRATNANTGASTLNINGLGAVAIQTNDAAALEANMIVVGGYYEVTYDANGTRFVLTSPHSLTEVNEGRTVTAGAGMTGGGALSSDITLNCIAGTGITVNADDIQTNDSEIVHDNLSGVTADEHVAHSGVSITAGTGMTGGGTIAATRTLNVIGGDGITANANDIALSATVAGTGMTHSAGVLNVIGGDGITANANDVTCVWGSVANRRRSIHHKSGRRCERSGFTECRSPDDHRGQRACGYRHLLRRGRWCIERHRSTSPWFARTDRPRNTDPCCRRYELDHGVHRHIDIDVTDQLRR
jgi:hypothetical protein